MIEEILEAIEQIRLKRVQKVCFFMSVSEYENFKSIFSSSSVSGKKAKKKNLWETAFWYPVIASDDNLLFLHTLQQYDIVLKYKENKIYFFNNTKRN